MALLPRALLCAEQDGQRCSGPVLLAGLVMGAGMVELSAGPLGQTSRFSLELLVLVVLQLVGPVLVTLLGMALLLPRWLDRLHTPSRTSRIGNLLAALVVGAVLLLVFLFAAVCAGAVTTPRADLIGELRDLLSGVLVLDLVRAMLRCGVFLAALCGWCQWRGQQGLTAHQSAAYLVSNLQVEGLMVLFALKLTWITLLDPIRLNGAVA